MDENNWQGHTAREQRLGDGCTGCAFDRANGRDEQCPHHNGGPSCMPFDRKDHRSIIWIPDVPAPEKPEPKVVYATVRDDYDSDGLESGWSLECRFDDNQKYGAVTIDRPFPELAHRICDFLNSPQELKAADEGTVPAPAEVVRYLHGAPTPDEIEAFHAKGHVVISKDLWEATRAMAEAFVTEPEPGDSKELWEAWASNVEKFRKRYEELRTEEP